LCVDNKKHYCFRSCNILTNATNIYKQLMISALATSLSVIDREEPFLVVLLNAIRQTAKSSRFIYQGLFSNEDIQEKTLVYCVKLAFPDFSHGQVWGFSWSRRIQFRELSHPKSGWDQAWRAHLCWTCWSHEISGWKSTLCQAPFAGRNGGNEQTWTI